MSAKPWSWLWILGSSRKETAFPSRSAGLEWEGEPLQVPCGSHRQSWSCLSGCRKSGCSHRYSKHSTPVLWGVYCQWTSPPGMAAAPSRTIRPCSEWYGQRNVYWGVQSPDEKTKQCRTKAGRIIKALSHPSNDLFELLQSGKCYPCHRATMPRLKELLPSGHQNPGQGHCQGW